MRMGSALGIGSLAATALINVKRRRTVEVIPGTVMKLWNQWQLRMMIVLSLFIQVLLVLLGSRRKTMVRNWVRVTLWLTYLSADWAATVSLGIISSGQGDSTDKTSPDPHTVISAFWAPFLLLHLGGPDSITAYSLEDNELWLRHLLGLLIQVAVVFYIFVRSWTSANVLLTVLAVPVFVSGLVKYGERTLSLRSASLSYLRDSLIPAPEPGPDYAKFMEDYTRLKAEGSQVGFGGVVEPTRVKLVGTGVLRDAVYIHEAYSLLEILRSLYTDLILSFHEKQDSIRVIWKKAPVEAFKLIEIELGYMYDILYTKAAIHSSTLGAVLRFTTLVSSTAALLVFWLVIQKHAFSRTDIILTYVLLLGSVSLEMYGAFALLFSDWTMMWLTGLRRPWADFIYQLLVSFEGVWLGQRRWSGLMAQYSLIGFSIKDRPLKCAKALKLFGIYETIEHYEYRSWKEVDSDLKNFVHGRIVEKFQRGVNKLENVSKILQDRGEHVLGQNNCLEKLGWSINKAEFDQSLLLWHIATDICFYADLDEYAEGDMSPKSSIAKSISDYMLYLLVTCPFMLPRGIGEIRFRDTVAEATRFFKPRQNLMSENNKSESCRLLRGVSTEIEPRSVKGDRSKSVLFDGCKLAKSLQSLVIEEGWSDDKKWEMISAVWVDLMCYAANECRWNQHAQQLRRGGELVTHVRLLMAHHGLSDQFQISAGHARMSITVIHPRR